MPSKKPVGTFVAVGLSLAIIGAGVTASLLDGRTIHRGRVAPIVTAKASSSALFGATNDGSALANGTRNWSTLPGPQWHGRIQIVHGKRIQTVSPYSYEGSTMRLPKVKPRFRILQIEQGDDDDGGDADSPDSGRDGMDANSPDKGNHDADADNDQSQKATASLQAQKHVRNAVTAPAPTIKFPGVSWYDGGQDGTPPDTNGDVGPAYYVQGVNTAVGIFNKSDGTLASSFTFNSLFATVNDGTPCTGPAPNHEGDIVTIYDSFTDHWILTDFSSTGNGSGAWYQCMAVSKTGDPISGGWNFYSWFINSSSLPDYPKFGVWPDGLYMSENLNGGTPVGAFAFDKNAMEAGLTAKSVSFSESSGASLLPGNSKVQAGAPPAGRPDIFAFIQSGASTAQFWAFHFDPVTPANSTFTALTSVSITSPGNPSGSVAELATQPGGATSSNLDTLGDRIMYQAQYQNLNGQESLWIQRTGAISSGDTDIRYWQFNINGGTTTASSALQNGDWRPDSTLHRSMPSGAVDSVGDYALGYSMMNATTPATLAYAGRLAGDPAGTFSRTEQTLLAGTGYECCQSSAGTAITRYGDYSSMQLDPDGCDFWFTSEYFKNVPTFTRNNGYDDSGWMTEIGEFRLNPNCTPLLSGTVSGTVTDVNNNPISGASITVGGSAATTGANGTYTVSVATGPWSEQASAAGYTTGSSSISVSNGGTLTQNFTLSNASTAGCFTTTSYTDWTNTNGANNTNVDSTVSPGNLTLSRGAAPIDQQQTTTSTTTLAMSPTSWAAESFVPSVSGWFEGMNFRARYISGTQVGLTFELHADNGGVPSGTVLATFTTAAFSGSSTTGTVGTASYYPPTDAWINAGATYYIVVKAAAGGGSYGLNTSNSNSYANGQAYTTTNSGSTWTAVPGNDIYMQMMLAPYLSSGTVDSTPNDSNPAPSSYASWSTLSWNATTPANTVVKFQVAGSNNSNSPGTFVGPDGTSGTFYTSSGASLAPQMDGYRYLLWKAYLSTSDTSQTPTVADVTVCYANQPKTSPGLGWNAPADIVYGTALSGAQLDATSSAPGSFAYSPANGAILNAGTNQVLNATFTPTDMIRVVSGGMVTAVINVDRAPLTVTASSGSSTYGSATGPVSAGYDGLVNGDTAPATPPACSTAATSHSNVGTYVTTCNGASDNDYTISDVNGTWTVIRANLTVTANSYTVHYGDVLPTLSFTGSGYMNGDSNGSLTGATCTTTATTSTSGHVTSPANAGNPGHLPYATNCTASSNNYHINFVPGTLTVLLTATKLTYVGSSPKAIHHNKNAKLSAKLTTLAGRGVVGRQMRISLRIGSHHQNCLTGLTNSNGVASCLLKPVNPPKGKALLSLGFNGDPHGAAYDYSSSTVSRNVTINP